MGSILLIIDGMTDPGFRAENYPALNSLRHRRSVRTVAPGGQAESLGCILRLLGYRELPEHLRAYADALGAGIEVQQDDLLLRCSWLSLGPDGQILRYGDAPVDYDPGEGLRYHALGGYRGLLILPGGAPKLQRIRTHPPYLNAACGPEQLMPEGSELLRQAFLRALSPTRCMVPWGQSRKVSLKPFPFHAAVITGTGLVRGIGRMTAMTIVPLQHATGDTDTCLEEKAEAALEAAAAYDFVLLHVNGADEAAHRRDPAAKQAFLKRVDRLVTQRLIDSPWPLSVAGDHGSNPWTGQHEGEVQTLYAKEI